MKITWRTELPQLLLITGMFIAALVSWSKVPQQVPVHWNLAGEVDRYGSKFEGLLLLPLITIGVYALLLFAPRVDPGKANYPGFWKTYTILRLAIVFFLAVIYGAGIASALGQANAMSRVIPISVGGLFVILGNYMGKLRPNWFVGVRTPWTLSSKKSWTKTHRLAGWCFVAIGGMIAVLGFFPTKSIFGGMLVASGLLLTWVIVYSYLVWRSDPERTQPAGTSPQEDT